MAPEATPFARGVAAVPADVGRWGLSEELRSFVREMPHERTSILAFVREAADSLAPGARVLDVGAGDAPYGELAAGRPRRCFADATLIEKALRVLSTNPAIDALAFADAGGDGPNLRLLDGEAGGRAQLDAVCWELIGAGAPPAGLELAGDEPLEALLRWLSLHTSVQWRQLARRGRRGSPDAWHVGDDLAGSRTSSRDARPAIGVAVP